MSTDPVMLAMAVLAKNDREKDDRISRLEHRVQELEGRADAYGLFMERASVRRINLNKEHRND